MIYLFKLRPEKVVNQRVNYVRVCPTAGVRLTERGKVALLQGLVEGQHPGANVQAEPGVVGRTSQRVHPAQVEVRPLCVAVTHGVHLEHRRSCRLANVHGLDVLILRKV